MLAYHNNIDIKNKYLERVIAHQKADEIVKGIYWENGKGCAVGCTIHGSDHSKYETKLGIPRILAILEDGIFEGLPNDRAKTWPEEFLNAINVGANLSNVWPKFACWLLTDKEHGVIKYFKTEKQKKIIQNISDAYSNYNKIDKKQWSKLHKDAYAAAAAYAADAAAYAAYAAAYAADADAAAYAAAKQKHRVAQANKLLELLRTCN